MANGGPSIIQVFDNYLIATGAATTTTVTSPPVPAGGNKAVMSAMVVNISAGATLQLFLEDSYDGKAWKDSGAGSISATAFGYPTEVSFGSVAFPLLRIRGVLTNAINYTAIFNAWFAFTQQ